MPWYKNGTIAATNGSKIITGTGTQFTNSLNGVSAGRMLLLPTAGTVQIYEIESVQSDTQLTLVSAFTGTTGTGKAYAIPTSPAVSIEQFAHEFASTLAYYQQQLSGWQQILTGTGNVALTTPDGTTVTVRSQQAWDAALNGKLTKGDYGMGGDGKTVTDANAIIEGGIYGLAAGSGNTPENDVFKILHIAYNVNSATQLAFNNSATEANRNFWFRYKRGGTWDAWRQVWHTGNLVKQANSFDATYGRVLTVGDSGSFGLGSALQSPITQRGMFFSYSDGTRALAEIGTGANGVGYQSTYNTNRRGQIYQSFSDGRLRHRISTSADNFDTTTPWITVWDNANLVKQTSQDDTTAGSMVLNGGHGLGANARPRAAGATGGAAGCGFFSYTSSNADNPFGGTGASGLHVQEAATYGWDLLGRDGGGPDFRLRQISAGTASPWLTLWTSANLVKQTGVNDTASGSVMLNGAHGLGRSQVSGVAMASIANGNDAATSGFAEAGSSTNWYYAFSPAVVAYRAGGADGTGQVMQIQVGPGGELGARYRAGNVWTDWAPHVTTNTSQTIAGQKTFSYNGSGLFIKPASASQSGYIRGLTHDNGNHWFVGKGDTTFDVVLANQYSTAQNNIILAEDGSTRLTVNSARLAYIRRSNTNYAILASGLNAVADSNGFYKTASPVVKLFTDGTSELTSEAEGITTERLSEGVYRISGCLGLNADRAWGGDDGGIDVPMCRNKLPRLWVDYGGDEGSSQINPDGSIVIRTYHRPHPDAPAFARNEIEGYANGDPIDIPHDTFISVRIQMPDVEVQEQVVETVPNEAENDVVLETSAQA